MKQPAVYILANKRNGTLYTGVTSNLVQRVSQHKNRINSAFASEYDCKMLVRFECFGDMETAIGREKRIKGGSRCRQIALIEEANPEWRDFFDEIV